MRGELALHNDIIADNPLLAVMWARLQEGSRLLFASGLQPELFICFQLDKLKHESI